jgi:ParB family chromosome partitioning protein
MRPMPPRKKKAPKPIGLTPEEIGGSDIPETITELEEAIANDGGAALASYRDPFGGHWVILAALPTDKVEPTPFQRQLSDTHAKRLAEVIPKVGRFLDPLICIRKDDNYWTPNGMHRLDALKRLGCRSVTALVIPEPEIAYRILALNTEKAHNLKDKSTEVVGMAEALAADEVAGARPESDWEFEFEEPAYLTIGHCYKERARYSGSAYMPFVKRCETFLDEPIAETLPLRIERAARLLEVDKVVNRLVKELKDAGHDSAYLKAFVVARINPLRSTRKKKSDAPPDFDETIDKVLAKAEKFDVSKVKAGDVSGAGGYG